MKKGMTTIYDIAKALDISASTVSRALRNHPDISKGMVEKIKITAKKLNYRPNTIAQSLKERKTKVIGVLVPELINPFYMAVLNGVEDMAFRKGYHMMVAQSGDSYQREVLNMESLSGQVDGILACIAQETRKFEHFRNVKNHNIPLVFFDRAPDRVASSKVIRNEEAIIYALTQHLIESGYQKIALITGSDHLSFCRSQTKGYTDAHLHQQLSVDLSLIRNEGLDLQMGKLAFQKLMKADPDVDAIIAANDAVTMAIYLETQRSGIQLGADLGLASAGSDIGLGLLTPPVTCTSVQGFDMGGHAAQLCINEMEKQGGTQKPIKEVIPCELIIRGSSLKTNHGLVVSSYSKYLNHKDSENPLVYIY